ncbi:Fc receptor-like protein 5 [Chaetodon trifascialis]|uniref:Fc receptor-like protein 5 n=1 Tax=Chaetodon trifascialis TaxID=109706 RepID=UPI003991CC3D
MRLHMVQIISGRYHIPPPGVSRQQQQQQQQQQQPHSSKPNVGRIAPYLILTQCERLLTTCLSSVPLITSDVLSVFITVLITLLDCGHTQDAQLTLEPNLANFFSGESVTFRCDMKEGAVTDWHYSFNQDDRQIASFSTKNLYSLNLMAHSSGTYQCIGHKNVENFKKQSNNVTLSVSAHRPKATLTAGSKSIPIGSTVTLYCSVDGSAGWSYEWSIKNASNSYEPLPGTENHIRISQHGLYRCRGKRGKTPAFLTEDSDVLRLEKTLSNRASVTIQPKWTHIFSGEEIAVLCEIEGGGGDAEWKYEWRTDSSNTPPAHREYRISSASPFHSGQYWCKGRQDSYTSTEWSEAFQLTVSSHKPTAVVRRTIGVEILTCSVEDSAEWKYYWFRRPTVFSENEIIRDGELDNAITILQGGIYHCRAGRGSQSFFTEDSNAVIIEKKVSKKPVVSLEPNWSLIFAGEVVTVRCYIDGGAEWEYEWSKPDSNTLPAHNGSTISAAVSHSGNYRCMGKHKSDWYSSTEWSEVMALTVSPHRPKANLSAEDGSFPVGGSVTLTCTVSPSSSAWEYFWYRGHKTSEPLTAQDAALRTSQISVSRRGLYWCRGGRGDPIYYTEFSDPVRVNAVATNRAVVTLRSNWPKIYSGEAVSLRCDIQGEEDEWEYEWATTSSNKPPNQKEYRINSVSQLNGGEYWCKGRLERSQDGSTAWSGNFSLVVYNNKPKPILTVSPLWLSSGDSVILKCEVEHPSAGWRFYWYKAVPTLSDSSYTYELLPGNSNGTEQGSYIVRGQTGTAGYLCRAGRGDSVYFTDYSQPEFVFSGDLHSEASLTLSPDRVQHFISVQVSLHCEGNSTRWRVMKLMKNSYSSVCSQWGTMSGSTCNLSDWQSGAVYWCESESEEFSNAVNITAAVDIILVSPVHSVAEGEFVSLGCKLKTEQPLSNVTFYKNEKVIQSDGSAMLNISAASKSDEGVYKCQHSGSVSSESWLLVRSPSSPSPVPSIAGLVFGILLVLLLPLLLLCWYKKSKGDVCIYDTINGSGITESGICGDPADSCEYGNMSLDSDS